MKPLIGTAFALIALAPIKGLSQESTVKVVYAASLSFPQVQRLGTVEIDVSSKAPTIIKLKGQFVNDFSFEKGGVTGVKLEEKDLTYSLEANRIIAVLKKGTSGAAFQEMDSIDDYSPTSGNLFIPLLPANWFPVPTVKDGKNGLLVLQPWTWQYYQARIFGQLEKPTKILFGVFPSLTNMNPTQSFTYSDWSKVGDLDVPGQIDFTSHKGYEIAIHWELDSKEAIPNAAAPPNLMGSGDVVYDYRLSRRGDAKAGTNSLYGVPRPFDLEKVADKNDSLLASMPEPRQSPFFSFVTMVFMKGGAFVLVIASLGAGVYWGILRRRATE